MKTYAKKELTTPKKRLIIGRIDKADFPKLGLFDIDVKIDTGAYTSVLHCHDIQEISHKKRYKVLQFKVLDPTHPEYQAQSFAVRRYEKLLIKSSNGQTEERFVIKSTIKLFNKKHKIKLSLTDRQDMKFPVLLGRKLLNQNFIVDVASTNLSYEAKQKKQLSLAQKSPQTIH